MLQIYSIQDPSVLRGVFNAIAVIFSNASYMSAATVVSLFTIFALAVHSVNSGNKEMPFQTWFIAALIFIGGFTTFVDIGIEDRHTAETTEIDNVPVAIAAPASVITGVGYNLTKLTETAYGHTGSERITTHGYLSPLQTIVNLRKQTIKECPAGLTNSVANGINFCGSLRNYVRDCVNVKTALKNIPKHGINQQNILDALKFESESYRTILYDSSMAPQSFTCKEAYEKISGAFADVKFDNMQESGGIKLFDDEPAIDTIKNALTALTGDIPASAKEEREFIYSMYMLTPMDEGTIDFLNENGSSAMAENLASSVIQRNYGWLVQGEMWTQTVNKFLALMESILYAIAPYIALMVLTGAMGRKTLALYVQLLIVMQLIPPMTVIVQDIILSDVQAKYLELSTMSGLNVGSLEFAREFSKYCFDQLALGSFYASTIVPTIAFSLVTGSAMAMSSVFKGAAVPAKDTDAVTQMASLGNSHFNLGSQAEYIGKNNAIMNQAEIDRSGSINMSQLAKNSVSNAHTELDTAKNTFTNSGTLSQAAKDGTVLSDTETVSLSRSISNSDTELGGFLTQKSAEVSKNHRLSETDTASVTAGLYLMGHGGFDTPTVMGMLGFDVKGGIGGKFEYGAGSQVALALDEARGTKDAKTGKYEIQSQFEEREANDYKNGQELKTDSSLINQNIHQRQLAYQRVQDAQQKYDQAVSFESSLGVSATDDKQTNIAKYAANPVVIDAINSRINSYGRNNANQAEKDGHEQYQNIMQQYEAEGTYLTKDQQQVAAYMRAAAMNSAMDVAGVFDTKGHLSENQRKLENPLNVDRDTIVASADSNPANFNINGDIPIVTPSVSDHNTSTSDAQKDKIPDLLAEYNTNAANARLNNNVGTDGEDWMSRADKIGKNQMDEFDLSHDAYSISNKAIGNFASGAGEVITGMGSDIYNGIQGFSSGVMDFATGSNETPEYNHNNVKDLASLNKELANAPELHSFLLDLTAVNDKNKDVYTASQLTKMIDEELPPQYSQALQDIHQKVENGTLSFGKEKDNLFDQAYSKSNLRHEIPW